jgi:hypothetical protein
MTLLHEQIGHSSIGTLEDQNREGNELSHSCPYVTVSHFTSHVHTIEKIADA